MARRLELEKSRDRELEEPECTRAPFWSSRVFGFSNSFTAAPWRSFLPSRPPPAARRRPPPRARLPSRSTTCRGCHSDSDRGNLDVINTRLLATLRIERVPAVGFVNERGLDVEGERDARARDSRALARRAYGAGQPHLLASRSEQRAAGRVSGRHPEGRARHPAAAGAPRSDAALVPPSVHAHRADRRDAGRRSMAFWARTAMTSRRSRSRPPTTSLRRSTSAPCSRTTKRQPTR